MFRDYRWCLGPAAGETVILFWGDTFLSLEADFTRYKREI